MADEEQPVRISGIDEIARLVCSVRNEGRTVGLVPTMGNLHEGHLSLMRRARDEQGFVVATIFVNPIQFRPGEDYEKYPRSPEQDGRLCAEVGVDAIFAPTVESMYPPESRTRVRVTGLDEPLCGHDRPGHFEGVATVVSKLFNLIPADAAYFGQKDFQQAKLIERLVADLNFPIEIVVCPTVRESDGLALSSRNAYLSPDERLQAAGLFQSLEFAETLVKKGATDPNRVRQEMRRLIESQPLAQIDYVELVDPETLEPAESLAGAVLAAVAVRFGATRLIDNAILNP